MKAAGPTKLETAEEVGDHDSTRLPALAGLEALYQTALAAFLVRTM